jgi:ribosomal subunit interface protein
MEKRIAFRHMEKTEPMEQHINEHLAKIEQFLEHEKEPIHIDLILEPSKVHAHHRVELRVKSPNYDRIVERENPDFYLALDFVINTMYDKLHEDKQRHIDERKSIGRHDDFKKER